MRKTTLAAAAALLVATCPTLPHAQPYPAKAIRFVVPFAPGGGTDYLARLIALKLSESMGQPVIIDNRPGGGGTIGADIVAQSPPDGYTLVLGSPGSLSVNPNLAQTPYDPLRDFTPLSLATISPFAISANAALPAGNIRELIELAKSRPGTLNYGTSGVGSMGYFAGEHLKMRTGVNAVHVAFKGSAPVSVALMSGEIQLSWENLPVVLPLARSGKLKVLGIGSPARSALAPELPAIAETVPGFEAITAFGVLGPAKMPAAIVKRLNDELVKALKEPKVSELLASRGMQSSANTPSEYARFIQREYHTYGEIIRKTGIKAE